MTTRAEALAALDELEGRTLLNGANLMRVNKIREALQQLPEVEELAEEPPVEESPIYIAPWERAILGHPDAIVKDPTQPGVPFNPSLATPAMRGWTVVPVAEVPEWALQDEEDNR